MYVTMQASVQVEHVTAVLEGLAAIMQYISERPPKEKAGEAESKAADAHTEPVGGQMFAGLLNMFGAEQHDPVSTSSPVFEACCSQSAPMMSVVLTLFVVCAGAQGDTRVLP